MKSKQIKAVHIQFVLPQEDTIAYKEKISKSFIEVVYKSQVFLTVIIILSILASTQSAYAAMTFDSQVKKVPLDHQSIDSSDGSFFSSSKLLIKLKPSSRDLIKNYPIYEETGIDSLNNLNKKHGVSKFEKVAKQGIRSKKDSPLFNWYLVSFGDTDKTITKKSSEFNKLKDTMASYKLNSNIEAIELNYIVDVLSIPDDPYYSSNGSWGQSYPDMWGIRKINSESAWDQTTGSSSIVVADIDTGVDRNHADLKDNMWVNTAEIPNNGIDDDGNGYIDDYYGWDWVNNDNDPLDDHGHGTHTAGTIAAVGNNGIGVIGVNWKSRIMALKFLNSGGSGYLSDGIKALQYAADMGANVSSNSWGCMCNSEAMDDAVRYEHDRGVIMVAAAGNSNMDALDFSPSSADGAIAVAASDYNDVKASFSNWGQKVDVAAPGVNILSAKASINNMCTTSKGNIIGTNYCVVSGTSMATPHVAGLAALILSKNPALTNEEVRQIIHIGASDLGASGKDSNFGYGRIDANGSVFISNTKPLSPIIISPTSRTTVFGNAFQIKGSVPGSSFASYNIEAGAGRDPTSWKILATSTKQIINGILATVNTSQLDEGTYIFRLTANDTNGKTYQFQVYDIEVDNFDATISFPLASVSLGTVDIIGTVQTNNGLPFASYNLEWCVGSVPTSCSTEGVALVNGGTQPVSNNKLASWDTSSLTDGQTYTIRLTVIASNGTSYQSSVTVRADKDLVNGWPKLFTNSYAQIIPTIADLDGDNIKEIVMAVPDGKIYVYRKNGTDFPGFPFSAEAGDSFNWQVNVGDLDKDGKKEIIAVAQTAEGGRIYIVRSDGTAYPGWSKPILKIAQSWNDGTPTIADLDGDEKKELVVMEMETWIDRTDVKLNALYLDGSQLLGFPRSITLPSTGFSPGQIYPSAYGALSVTDFDKDGISEIAWSYSNRVYLFDNSGNILPGWPFIAPNYNGKIMLFESAPASGDVDGDGNLELFSIARGQNCGGCETQLYGWRKDGTVLPGWPKTDQSDRIKLWYTETRFNTPSFVDIDNDNKDEIIVGLDNLAIFDFEGKKNLSTPPRMNTQPTLSDVDGDGRLEFGGSWYNTLTIVKEDSSKYSIYWQKILASAYLNTPPIFADLDNNGRMELAVVHRPSSASNDGTLNLVAYLWEIPALGLNTSKYDWPMFSHDSQRTGRLVITANTTDTTPPITAITSPANGSIISGTVILTYSAFDNIGVSKVEVYRNGALVSARTSNPFTFVWDTSQAADGMYILHSKAYDAANNVGVSLPVTVSVSNTKDNIPPTVSITNPSNNSIISRKSKITMAADASDNVGIAKVEFYVNGLLKCGDTTQSYTCNWSVLGKHGETYLLQAKAYDAQNNTGSSTIVKVTSK